MKKPLIVVSNLRQTIKLESKMNTSLEAVDKLNEMVRAALAKAYISAANDGRKTVMARDFE